MGEPKPIDYDAIVENFDITRDTSPMHVMKERDGAVSSARGEGG